MFKRKRFVDFSLNSVLLNQCTVCMLADQNSSGADLDEC